MNDLERKMKRLELEICLDELTMRKHYFSARRRMDSKYVIGYTLLGSILFGFLLLSKNKNLSKMTRQAGEGVKFLSQWL